MLARSTNPTRDRELTFLVNRREKGHTGNNLSNRVLNVFLNFGHRSLDLPSWPVNTNVIITSADCPACTGTSRHSGEVKSSELTLYSPSKLRLHHWVNHQF